MIVPMKKCLVAMLDSDKPSGLKALRRIGLVHVEELSGSGEALEKIRAERELLEKAVAALSMRKAAKLRADGGFDLETAMVASARMEELAALERGLAERAAFLARECERTAPWGDFIPEDLKAIESCGLKVRLHALPSAPPPAFPEGADAILAGKEKDSTYYLSFARPELDSAALPEAFPLPEKGQADMRKEIAELKERIAGIEEERDDLASALPAMRKALARTMQEERFEVLRTGMASDGPVAYLTGWVPAPDLEALRREAAGRGWALADEDPADDEMPPTKVKNKAAIAIIQPLFDFLGTVPGYREYEISVWFLFFFSIFFAMIFGDAGYGSLLLLAGLVAAIRFKAGGKRVPAAVKLLLYLSAMTVAWGTVTVSWFSIDPKYLPALLKLPAIPLIANTNPDSKAVGDNIKIFCFLLGLAQLSLAHVKNLIRDIRSPKMLAQVGFLLEVFGLFWLVLYLVISPDHYPLPNYSVYCIGIGFALVFVFGSWTGKLGGSILESLKNFISIFLGTVSVMADIISYIRLWAVGLAGVAIAQTVNGMGIGLMGWGSLLRGLFSILGLVLLFGLGHGLNMLMSTLSVVVHGVRLNLLEFSGHLGMEWSGYKYDPFRETAEGGD